MELYKKAAASDTKRLEKEIPYLQKEGLDEQINEIAKSTEDSFNQLVQLSQRTAERMQDNFSDLFFDIWKGKLKTAEDYFTAFTDSIGRIWSNMAGQMATEAIFGSQSVGGKAGGGGIVGWLADLILSAQGPEQLGSAKGNAFGPRGLIPFARGGIVDRPTVFRFARGTGLMGEDGPEAIVPLKRMSSGKLGVESAGGGTNVQVIVQNYTGAQVTQREQQGPGDVRQVFVMVGNDINAGGPTARALESTYGLRRTGR
jgi:lambda family phage tail tape measure protein